MVNDPFFTNFSLFLAPNGYVTVMKSQNLMRIPFCWTLILANFFQLTMEQGCWIQSIALCFLRSIPSYRDKRKLRFAKIRCFLLGDANVDSPSLNICEPLLLGPLFLYPFCTQIGFTFLLKWAKLSHESKLIDKFHKDTD